MIDLTTKGKGKQNYRSSPNARNPDYCGEPSVCSPGRNPKVAKTNPSPSTTNSPQKKYQLATTVSRQYSNTVVHTTNRAACKFKRRHKNTYPLDKTTTHFSPNTVMQAIKGHPIPHGPIQPVSVIFWYTSYMKAGHNHPDPQAWQILRPMDLLWTISFLCIRVKVLDRLLLSKLTHHLQMADSQKWFYR